MERVIETDMNIEGIIKKSLKDKYLFSFKKSYLNDVLQMIFFVLGIVCFYLLLLITK